MHTDQEKSKIIKGLNNFALSFMLLILLRFIMVDKWNYEEVKISFLSVESTIKNWIGGEESGYLNEAISVL